MLDKHIISIGFTVPRFNHLAIASGIDRRTARCGVIDSAVGLNLFMNWMFTPEIKARTDTKNIKWRAQKGLAHAKPFGSVIIAQSAAIGIADCFIGFAAIGT